MMREGGLRNRSPYNEIFRSHFVMQIRNDELRVACCRVSVRSLNSGRYSRSTVVLPNFVRCPITRPLRKKIAPTTLASTSHNFKMLRTYLVRFLYNGKSSHFK